MVLNADWTDQFQTLQPNLTLMVLQSTMIFWWICDKYDIIFRIQKSESQWLQIFARVRAGNKLFVFTAAASTAKQRFDVCNFNSEPQDYFIVCASQKNKTMKTFFMLSPG